MLCFRVFLFRTAFLRQPAAERTKAVRQAVAFNQAVCAGEDLLAGQVVDCFDAAVKQVIRKILNLSAVFTENRNFDFIVADIRM